MKAPLIETTSELKGPANSLTTAIVMNASGVETVRCNIRSSTDAARPQQLHRLRTFKARSRLLHYALDMRCRDASCTLVGNSRGHLLVGAPLARLASCPGCFELEARE